MPSRFQDRTGLATDFFEPEKMANVAVEAPIEEVSKILTRAQEFFQLGKGKTLRIQTDVFGQPRGESWPHLTAFQLQGHGWTQLAGDIRGIKALPLGQFLSRELKTRCLSIEITDDAYYSHALFDQGETDELVLMASNLDMKPALSALGLEVPDEYKDLGPNDWDQYDEAEYNYRRDGSPTRDAANLATEVGCYLHTPFSPEGTSHGVHDLRTGEVVRMDVLWAEKADA